MSVPSVAFNIPSILLLVITYSLTVEARYASYSSFMRQDFAHINPICKLRAKAYITGPGLVTLKATVTFEQAYYGGAPVNVTVRDWLLDRDPHAIHIHRWGNLTKNCASTGPHFNPDLVTHGGPMDYIRHVGDLGNINRPVYRFIDNRLSLFGRNSIVGRSVVVHDKPDDFGRGKTLASITSGNAGRRIACGVIGRLEPELCLQPQPDETTEEPEYLDAVVAADKKQF